MKVVPNYLQKNINISFNNFIYRLIGFNEEDNLKFQYYNEKNEIEIESINYECIIADYLSLINDYNLQTQKIEYDITCISVPDFYTPFKNKN